MKKKVVVLGGGTGMSTLLRGLKEFPLDITAIVSVCDDGESTGKLRQEFGIPAVGDIRKVLVALSETEPLIEKLLHYRFQTGSDLDGHAVGNLLLTALVSITGSLTDGTEALSKVLNLKGKVLPLTEDSITLMAQMKDGSVVKGECNITKTPAEIKKVYYEKEPKIGKSVLEAIENADLIVFSMGSIYTSLIPNLLSSQIIEKIDKSKVSLMYVCNMMTQPGETDKLTASQHLSILNQYLGKRKVDTIVVNTGKIDKKLVQKYETLEQKDLVKVDMKELEKVVPNIISNNYATVEDNVIRHKVIKLGSDIFSSLL